MINLTRMPGWLRNVIIVIYSLFYIGMAIALLSVAYLEAFAIQDINLSNELMVLLGFVLIAPLIPFASKIALPGGTDFNFSREEADKIKQKGQVGEDQAVAAVANMDFENLFSPGSAGVDDQ